MKTAILQGCSGPNRLHHRAASSASSSSDLLPVALVLAALVEALGHVVDCGCIPVVLVAVPGHLNSTRAAPMAELLEKAERLEELATAKLMGSRLSLFT